MIDGEPVLGLPLVYHLVQQRVLHFGPRMSGYVAAADRDLEWAAGPQVHRQLAEPGAHASREAYRSLAQGTTEVSLVEEAVRGFETVKQGNVP